MGNFGSAYLAKFYIVHQFQKLLTKSRIIQQSRWWWEIKEKFCILLIVRMSIFAPLLLISSRNHSTANIALLGFFNFDIDTSSQKHAAFYLMTMSIIFRSEYHEFGTTDLRKDPHYLTVWVVCNTIGMGESISVLRRHLFSATGNFNPFRLFGLVNPWRSCLSFTDTDRKTNFRLCLFVP